MTTESQYVQRYSLRIEAALRHAFIAELYSYLWAKNPDIALRVYEADADDMGFDVVLSQGVITRHVQLKSIFEGSTTKHVNLRDCLTSLSGGCAVVCFYRASDLKIVRYGFLGFTSDRESLKFTAFSLAKHTRGNAAGVKKMRSDTRKIPLSAFFQNLSISDVAFMMLNVKKAKSE